MLSVLRKLMFTDRLNIGWEIWAIISTSKIVGVNVAFIAAYDYFFENPYPAFAFALSCNFSWFRILQKFRTIDASLIGIGGIITYCGALLFNVESISGSLLTLLGFGMTLRSFSHGPPDFQPVYTKKKRIRKRPKGG